MNVYDFDGTIYKGDSTLDFYLFALRRKPALVCCWPRQLRGILLYKLHKISKTDMKEYFYCFLQKIPAEEMLEEFWNEKQCRICSWYLQQKKADDVVISASPEFLLQPVCERLQIKSLIASRVDMHTGRYAGKNCRGKEKVERFYAVYPQGQIEKFYSDSQADLPLAQISGKAFLVKNGSIKPWICE